MANKGPRLVVQVQIKRKRELEEHVEKEGLHKEGRLRVGKERQRQKWRWCQ